MWVDTGSASVRSHRIRRPITSTSIRAPRSGSRPPSCSTTTSIPTVRPSRCVAVSEPSNNGTLTGNLTDGFAYTPGSAAALVDTDIGLDYLVTDTDGHVTQEDITIRILAAGDTNRPRWRVADVARTNCGGSTASCSCSAMISILTVVPSAWWRCRHRPTARDVQQQLHQPTPPTSGSPVSRPSPTPSATPRDSLPLGTLTVWVDTGAASAGSHRIRRPITATSIRAPRSGSRPPSFSTTTSIPRSAPDGRGGVRTCQQRHPDRNSPTAWPSRPAARPALVDTDSDSTTSSPTPTVTSPKSTSPSASSPPATPTDPPSPYPTQPTNAGTSTVQLFVLAMISILTVRPSAWSGCRHRPTGGVVQQQLHQSATPPTPGSPVSRPSPTPSATPTASPAPGC